MANNEIETEVLLDTEELESGIEELSEENLPEKTNGSYFINLASPVKSLYLGETQIDLISITQISNPEELETYIKNCAEFSYTPEEIERLKANFPESKREIFENYRANIPTVKNSREESYLLRKNFESSNLDPAEVDEIMDLYLAGYPQLAIEILAKKNKPALEEIRNNFFKRHLADYDEVKTTTYEEIESLGKKLSDFDCLNVTCGKYSSVKNGTKFDDYHISRVLAFAKKNNLPVRYHSLLTRDMQLGTSPKEELISYIQESINFINSYNAENKLNGAKAKTKPITSIDLMNEIVSFSPNSNGEYESIWDAKGLTMQDLIEVFDYAKKHKPEGVTYIYNEAFVEISDKRKKQLEVAKCLASAGLIDTFGTQMHISINTKEEDIRKSFEDLKSLQEETGLQIAITEFDCFVPHKSIEKATKKGYDASQIRELAISEKRKKIQEVEKAASDANLALSEIGYWSATDSMDHNKRRARLNGKKANFVTLYGGLYGDELLQPQKQKTDSLTQEISSYKSELENILSDRKPIKPSVELANIKANDQSKVYSKTKQVKMPQTVSSNDSNGFANVPILLIMILLLVAVIHILVTM